MKRSGGRNVHGHITRRHQGGGHKRRYRVIDFKRLDKDGVPAKVASVEYDPNRTANIALLHYADGEKRYILAPVGLTVGDVLAQPAPTADIRPGNTPAAAEHPGRHGDPQRGAQAGPRRADDPLRRLLRAS